MAEADGVGDGVADADGDGVADADGDGVADADGDGVADADGDGEATGAGVTVGVATTFTPLLHTNFLPDLTQVNLYPLTFDVEFNFVQVPPAFAVAATARLDGNREMASRTERAGASRRIERE